MQSISNGSLMRVTPLAVWASNLLSAKREEKDKDIEEFKKVIVADTTFTHPHNLVHETVFIYSAVIA